MRSFQKPGTTGPVRLRVYWGGVWSTLYLRRELLRRLGLSISSMTPNDDKSVDIVIETEAGLDVVAGLRSIPGVAGAVRIPLADGDEMPTYCVFIDERRMSAIQTQADTPSGE
ncbi:MAG: hypothetical protein IH862_11960 [Chloroflexi bacterium]|nr:hypothetical protein [Chloroflexota bacterium]